MLTEMRDEARGTVYIYRGSITMDIPRKYHYGSRDTRITEACCFLFATLLSLWLDISAVQHDSVYRWIILSVLDVSLQL